MTSPANQTRRKRLEISAMNMLSFHKLASARGDGLHPRLAEFLEVHATRAGSNVEQLSAYRAGEPIQAGPSPVRNLDGRLPEGVLRFPTAKGPQAGRKTVAS
jgi:hypothetical protein